jgi:hypothetical protein
MFEGADPRLNEIWEQRSIAVLYRPGDDDLYVKTPYALGNKEWFQDGRNRRSAPKWNPEEKHWRVPRSHFKELTRRLVERFRRAYIIQPYNEKEVCAPACWNASGLDCECSCLGQNHGNGQPGGRWYIISETCAIKWGSRGLKWNLIEIKRPERQKIQTIVNVY